MLTMNHHPLHTDAHYAETETQFGRNVVVGNLVYSLVLGMSVPDVSGKAIANLEIESLQPRAPTFHGDTIYAETGSRSASRRASPTAASSPSRRPAGTSAGRRLRVPAARARAPSATWCRHERGVHCGSLRLTEEMGGYAGISPPSMIFGGRCCPGSSGRCRTPVDQAEALCHHARGLKEKPAPCCVECG